MGRLIGIDLGTTKCAVAAMVNGEPTIIPNRYGDLTTPSVVSFDEQARPIIGKQAFSQATINPYNSFFNLKRSMGTSLIFKVGNKKLRPQQIVGLLLMEMKSIAQEYLKETIDGAVVSVPACFNDAQRWFTIDAGSYAGLKIERIINEPSAAALYYYYRKRQSVSHLKDQETCVIYDLGGGTFDVSLLNIGESCSIYEILAVGGNTDLGGINFDNIIARWLIDKVKKLCPRTEIEYDAILCDRLMETAEQAKITLSSCNSVEIHIPYLTKYENNWIHLDAVLSREEYEKMTETLISETIRICESTIVDSGLKKNEINRVLLIGKQSRMPAINHEVKKIFSQKTSVHSIFEDEIVALGTAIEAGILEHADNTEDLLMLDVLPYSLGVETLGGVSSRMIERNATIPTSRREIFTTSENNQTDVLIKVLQGEREFTRDNRVIGILHLTGIEQAPARIPQIEVCFDINHNGVISVSAKDLATGNEVKSTIKDRGEHIEPKEGLVCPYGRWLRGDTTKAIKYREIHEKYENYTKKDSQPHIFGLRQKFYKIISNWYRNKIKKI